VFRHWNYNWPAAGYKGFLLGPIAGFVGITIITLLAWTLVWKGISLWRSARHEQKGWFIALLIINSLGLLPIIYLAFFQKKAKKAKKKKK
jgi:H+/Cl- antiporter ClcA